MSDKPRNRQCLYRAGMDKLLEPWEQKQLLDYLHGRARSLRDNSLFPTETVAGRRFVLMIDLLINTGLRAVELTRLRVQDTPYQLDVNVIAARESEAHEGRIIPISSSLANEIKKYIREIRPKTMRRHLKRSDPSLPVFYSRCKKPYCRVDEKGRLRASVALNRCILSLGKKAGIRMRLTPQVLRRVFAVRAYMSGVNLIRLGELMGISIVGADRYLCPAVPALRTRADGNLGELFDHRPRRNRTKAKGNQGYPYRPC